MTVQDSTISLTWTAPFTLDITDIDPDITYCVGVANSTSSSIQCGITETGFSFSIPPDSACHNYMFTFTVTPVNVVGNGTSSTYYYYLQGDCHFCIFIKVRSIYNESEVGQHKAANIQPIANCTAYQLTSI